MRLPEFIENNLEKILEDWDEFAGRIWPGHGERLRAELRDHAEEILRAIVHDMRSDQSPQEQSDKSHGLGVQSPHSLGLDNASNLHGSGRVASGFQLMEVVSEYRALRASVFRLWQGSNPTPDQNDLTDLTRFNESIDQSLTHAIQSFTEGVDQARRLFLAILGHDLRNPIVAIKLWAQVLNRQPAASEPAAAILSTAESMERMIGDLLDFAASGFGGSMPITRARADLCEIANEVVKEVRGANPNREVIVECTGDGDGQWDARRIRQVIANLVSNAVQHGSDSHPVKLRLDGKSDRMVLEVHNHGEPIPPDVLPVIFDPLRRNMSKDTPRRQRDGIGLGLYIAHEVVTAHGGTIDVSSDGSGTSFTVTIPRA